MQHMLAKLGSKKDLNKKDWIYEPKFDGTRVFVFKRKNKITLINRRGKNITYRYPELSKIWKNIPGSAILDAELVVLNKKGLPDFNLLQQREQLERKLEIELRSKQIPATLFVFDILEKNKKNLTNLPLRERKKFLKIKKSPYIQICPSTTNGKALWKNVLKLNLEGVMAKNLDSRYEGRRSHNWLKIKNFNTVDCIIIGFSTEKRKISALCLACYHKKKLIYVGRVAAGLSEQLIANLLPKLQKLKTKKILVENPPSDWRKHNIKWLRPKLICEVRFMNITKKLELRAPTFLRSKFDKKLEECIL